MLDGALTLAAAYERLALSKPALAGQLSPIGAAHRAHAAELTRMIGGPAPSVSVAPSGGPGPGDVAGLRVAEQKAQRVAATLCGVAPAARAALLGSIAAARAAHAEALRDAA